MPDEFQKKEQKEGCDRKKIKPAICSRGRDDEQAAGFVDLQTGEFTGVFCLQQIKVHEGKQNE